MTNQARKPQLADDWHSGEIDPDRPDVSIVLPAYNEAAIVEQNLARLCHYMESLERKYRWEIILINDGSTDATGTLAEEFAHTHPNVRVYHHLTNFGIGEAFRYAFKLCRGTYIITLDTDLSYAPEHIEPMLAKLIDTRANIVVASPYMTGGRISNVPRLRRVLSTWANRFLSIAAKGRLSTLTSMARAYDARFLESLNLRSAGMDIMPETVHKAMMLGARVEEIPAHLDWGPQTGDDKPKRRSSMRLLRHTFATLLSGFIFRPVIFFLLPGMLLLLFSAWVGAWALIHFAGYYQELTTQYPSMLLRASAALEMAFDRHTHTFVIGLLAAMLATQLISLGILALQSKSYFEELFHLGTTIFRAGNQHNGRD
ncbi:MAG TPA: glycosyltransferase family 2 protein [Mycobacterium sp.]|nr:glycosyltransferase family 2 protein [Mycobacterium sp.]